MCLVVVCHALLYSAISGVSTIPPGSLPCPVVVEWPRHTPWRSRSLKTVFRMIVKAQLPQFLQPVNGGGSTAEDHLYAVATMVNPYSLRCFSIVAEALFFSDLK